MSRAIDYNAALEIASHEAIVRQAYKDSKGVWTWSIGITNATGHNVERYIDKPQPLEHCLAVYVWALRKYADDVSEAFGSKKLTPEQFAAAVSFHYNTGAIKRATWVKQFIAGDVHSARRAIMDWTKPASLKARREKERDLFFDGKWSNDGSILEYTAVNANHTPVWSSAKRIKIDKELKAAFGAEVKSLPSGGEVITTKPQTKPTNIIIAALTIIGGLIFGFAKALGWIN